MYYLLESIESENGNEIASEINSLWWQWILFQIASRTIDIYVLKSIPCKVEVNFLPTQVMCTTSKSRSNLIDIYIIYEIQLRVKMEMKLSVKWILFDSNKQHFK